MNPSLNENLEFSAEIQIQNTGGFDSMILRINKVCSQSRNFGSPPGLIPLKRSRRHPISVIQSSSYMITC